MRRTELQTEGTPDASQIKLAWRIMQPQKGTRARSSIGTNPRRKASLLKPWPGGARTAQQRSAGESWSVGMDRYCVSTSFVIVLSAGRQPQHCISMLKHFPFLLCIITNFPDRLPNTSMHDSSPFVRATARSRCGMPPSAVWPALCSCPRPEGSRRATRTGSTIFYLSRD